VKATFTARVDGASITIRIGVWSVDAAGVFASHDRSPKKPLAFASERIEPAVRSFSTSISTSVPRK
jgi:hypothetical protein